MKHTIAGRDSFLFLVLGFIFIVSSFSLVYVFEFSLRCIHSLWPKKPKSNLPIFIGRQSQSIYTFGGCVLWNLCGECEIHKELEGKGMPKLPRQLSILESIVWWQLEKLIKQNRARIRVQQSTEPGSKDCEHQSTTTNTNNNNVFQHIYVPNFIHIRGERIRTRASRASHNCSAKEWMNCPISLSSSSLCSMLFAFGRLVCDEIQYCTEPWSHGVVNFSNKLAIVFVFGQSSFVRLAVHLLG